MWRKDGRKNQNRITTKDTKGTKNIKTGHSSDTAVSRHRSGEEFVARISAQRASGATGWFGCFSRVRFAYPGYGNSLIFFVFFVFFVVTSF